MTLDGSDAIQACAWFGYHTKRSHSSLQFRDELDCTCVVCGKTPANRTLVKSHFRKTHVERGGNVPQGRYPTLQVSGNEATGTGHESGGAHILVFVELALETLEIANNLNMDKLSQGAIGQEADVGSHVRNPQDVGRKCRLEDDRSPLQGCQDSEIEDGKPHPAVLDQR